MITYNRHRTVLFFDTIEEFIWLFHIELTCTMYNFFNYSTCYIRCLSTQKKIYLEWLALHCRWSASENSSFLDEEIQSSILYQQCIANANHHLYILVLILPKLVIEYLSCKFLFFYYLADFFCFFTANPFRLKWS